eukprot:symbB.v1.2.019080.t1/scaffold1547.1/size112433/1
MIRPEEFAEAVRTLSKVFGNILSQPTNEKYRSLRKDNAVVKEKLKHPSCVASLQLCGFVEDGDFYVCPESSDLTTMRRVSAILKAVPLDGVRIVDGVITRPAKAEATETSKSTNKGYGYAANTDSRRELTQKYQQRRCFQDNQAISRRCFSTCFAAFHFCKNRSSKEFGDASHLHWLTLYLTEVRNVCIFELFRPMAELGIRCICEFLGTFLLVFSVVCIKLTGQPLWSGFAVASAQMILVQSMGDKAVGIFNPVMSIALGTVRSLGGPGIAWSQVLALVVSQFGGAFLAALISTVSLGKELPVGDYMEYGTMALGLCECTYTFMICFVALNMMSPKRNGKEKQECCAVAIGSASLAGAYGAGNISGGLFNPALAVALDITSPSLGFNGFGLVISAFQCSAAPMAAWIYSKVRPEEFEKPESEGKVFEKCVSETVGSLLVVLTASLSYRTGTIIAPLCLAAAMTSMVFALGDISGGHFNPAISCANALSTGKGLSWQFYCLSQIGGACLASLLTVMILAQHPRFGAKLPYDLTQAVLSEGIFTFLLCFVFLGVTVSNRTKASQFSGLAVGFCIIGGFAISSVSGGLLNPVICLGLSFVGGGFGAAM